MMLKNQQCDDYKNEYASQLQQTNMHQNDHYHTHMPQVFQVNMSTCSNATGVSGKYVIIILICHRWYRWICHYYTHMPQVFQVSLSYSIPQVFQVNLSLLCSNATDVSGKYVIIILSTTGVSGKYVIIMLQVFQVNISLLYSYATGVSGKYDIVIYLRLKRGMVICFFLNLMPSLNF